MEIGVFISIVGTLVSLGGGWYSWRQAKMAKSAAEAAEEQRVMILNKKDALDLGAFLVKIKDIDSKIIPFLYLNTNRGLNKNKTFNCLQLMLSEFAILTGRITNEEIKLELQSLYNKISTYTEDFVEGDNHSVRSLLNAIRLLEGILSKYSSSNLLK